ncbi:MAG: hypothetical protein M3N54_04520 [Acidobacteriota bacterium]|nr:hypothetical protein [Acidobacteriota bacterium]
MRYFLSGRAPAGSRILFVESGSRSLAEGILPHLRSSWAEGYEIDLVTCYGGLPAGFPPDTTVFRVIDFASSSEGWRELIRRLRERDYAYAGIICSGEPIMTKWKWLIALRVPAKFFVVNENGDYFWLHREHSAVLREFALVRGGLSGAGAIRTFARLVVFPFTILFLLMYAFTAHARRALRMALSTQR